MSVQSCSKKMKLLIVVATCLTIAGTSALPQLRQNSDGMQIFDIDGRIINGQDASVGQFKFQAGLSIKYSNQARTWCGGALISPSYVLTAAHCTYNIESVIVYLGANERTLDQEARIAYASDVIIHPGYDKDTAKNDISIIHLTEPVELKENIDVVALPPYGSSNQYINAEVVASGWGKTSDDSNRPAAYLQFIAMTIVNGDLCTKTYSNKHFTDTNVCVDTSNGKSTCEGDSGGPLVLESTKLLVGLTSFGSLSGCTKGYPIVFTRITSFTTWIYDETGVRN